VQLVRLRVVGRGGRFGECWSLSENTRVLLLLLLTSAATAATAANTVTTAAAAAAAASSAAVREHESMRA